MYKFFTLGLLAFSLSAGAKNLIVGNGQTYSTVQAAAKVAVAGDTILIKTGTYTGNIYVDKLKGSPGKLIAIKGEAPGVVTIKGGVNGLYLSDPEYVMLLNLNFEEQTGNGINIDDGGDYSTPAQYITLDNCNFSNLDPKGTNLVKLSGVDHFTVNNCALKNGAPNGSGIDMVGCHYGTITASTFENNGFDGIQTKGGCKDIIIARCYFTGNERGINIGGSTGLPYFRPSNAIYEASDIKVYANAFTGNMAPVAFVGAVNSEVVNNTIYFPKKFVLRILQETVDTTRFLPCRDNSFINNIVVRDDQVMVDCNVGPNTEPTTFTFANNLWLHTTDPSKYQPILPVTETDAIYMKNPRLVDPDNRDFHITAQSPAIGAGMKVSEPKMDLYNRPFADKPSIGAVEGGKANGIFSSQKERELNIYPNPVRPGGNIYLAVTEVMTYVIIDISGRTVASGNLQPGVSNTVDISQELKAGAYILKAGSAGTYLTGKVLVQP